MKDIYEQIKNMSVEEFVETFLSSFIIYLKKQEKTKAIYKSIFNEPVDYKTLYSLIPSLDEDDISFILKYDKDYSISFLLSLVDVADEDDLTKQAIYLIKRHNLNYILPLLPFINEDEIRQFYKKKAS